MIKIRTTIAITKAIAINIVKAVTIATAIT